MATIVCLGIDVGLAHSGFCVASIDRTALFSLPEAALVGAVAVLACGVVSTKPDPRASARKSWDYAKRIREMVLVAKQVHGIFGNAGPDGETFWAAETFSAFGARISAASLQTLAVYGAMLGLAASLGERFIPVTPAEGKKLVTGSGLPTSKGAIYALGKDRLEAAVFGGYTWTTSCTGTFEHAADAFAIAVSGLKQYARLTA